MQQTVFAYNSKQFFFEYTKNKVYCFILRLKPVFILPISKKPFISPMAGFYYSVTLVNIFFPFRAKKIPQKGKNPSC